MGRKHLLNEQRIEMTTAFQNSPQCPKAETVLNRMKKSGTLHVSMDQIEAGAVIA